MPILSAQWCVHAFVRCSVAASGSSSIVRLQCGEGALIGNRWPHAVLGWGRSCACELGAVRLAWLSKLGVGIDSMCVRLSHIAVSLWIKRLSSTWGASANSMRLAACARFELVGGTGAGWAFQYLGMARFQVNRVGSAGSSFGRVMLYRKTEAASPTLAVQFLWRA